MQAGKDDRRGASDPELSTEGRNTAADAGREPAGLDQLTTPGRDAARPTKKPVAIDAGLCARIDARVAAEEAAGVPLPDRAQARDNGPDPLGIGWAWAGQPPET